MCIIKLFYDKEELSGKVGEMQQIFVSKGSDILAARVSILEAVSFSERLEICSAC